MSIPFICFYTLVAISIILPFRLSTYIIQFVSAFVIIVGVFIGINSYEGICVGYGGMLLYGFAVLREVILLQSDPNRHSLRDKVKVL